MLSPSDTAIVFVLALLLFGPEQLPKLARQLGEAMRHVQNTTHTFMQEMERAADANEPHMHGMGDSHTHGDNEQRGHDIAEPVPPEAAPPSDVVPLEKTPVETTETPST